MMMNKNERGVISNMGSRVSTQEDTANNPERCNQTKEAHGNTGSNPDGVCHSRFVHNVGSELFIPYEIIHDNEHRRTLSYAETVKLRHG